MTRSKLLSEKDETLFFKMIKGRMNQGFRHTEAIKSIHKDFKLSYMQAYNFYMNNRNHLMTSALDALNPSLAKANAGQVVARGEFRNTFQETFESPKPEIKKFVTAEAKTVDKTVPFVIEVEEQPKVNLKVTLLTSAGPLEARVFKETEKSVIFEIPNYPFILIEYEYSKRSE